MKFVKIKCILITLVILCLVAFSSAIRKNRFTFRNGVPLNYFVNRGFSYLNLNNDIFKDVEKLVMSKPIFNYDIDTTKNIFGDFYVSQENFRSALNRNLTVLNADEMRKNQEVSIRGDYQITTGSDVCKYGNSHVMRRVRNSHVFSDTIGKLVLTMNHNKNFPNLHHGFVQDAYKTFFESPNKNYANHTIADLYNDKGTMKLAIKFFSDYGTHYISQGTFGYRFGFYQEYKHPHTILKDKNGNTPLPDLTKISFLEKSNNITKEINVESSKIETSSSSATPVVESASSSVSSSSSSSVTTVESSSSSTSGGSTSSITESSTSSGPTVVTKEEHKTETSTPAPVAAAAPSVTPEPTPAPTPVPVPVPAPVPGTSTATPVTAGEKTTSDVNQFSIGQCTIDKLFLKAETCNAKNPRPVKYEVEPIQNLFNPLFQIKKDFGFGGKIIDKYTMKKIFNNMSFLAKEIQFALDNRLFIVTNVEAFKLTKKDAAQKECLQISTENIGKIYKNYKQTMKRMSFQQDTMVKDRHVPVSSIRNYATFKDNWAIATKEEEGLYWCYTRANNISPEELKNGLWTKRRLLKEVKVVVDHDAKSFEDAGYKCQEMWNFSDKTGKEDRWHICTLYTSNFMDIMLITDIKFFEFNPKMAKCTSGKLKTWIDGRSYECDCDVNLRQITDDPKQGDTYLCIARKSDPKSKPLKPNQPVVTTGPNAPKLAPK